MADVIGKLAELDQEMILTVTVFVVYLLRPTERDEPIKKSSFGYNTGIPFRHAQILEKTVLASKRYNFFMNLMTTGRITHPPSFGQT